jgi:hypothetical protein
MRKTKNKRNLLIAGTALVGLATSAHAGLTSVYQFNGKGDWSIDAIGSNGDPVGTVSAVVPVGSTVQKAMLLSSTIYGASHTPDIDLAGTTYSGAAWSYLGETGSIKAYSTDVTAQMQAAIGGGSASTFNFSVRELSNNSSTDGEILAIAYSNPGSQERTIAFLTGASQQAGDTTTINFSSPLADVGQPGFEALISLGIGYSYQQGNTGQRSIVDGNGRRLTSAAGGEDDGTSENGGLITVGGLGDSPTNPDPSLIPTNPRDDDELYDLGQGNSADPTPFLSNGLTTYSFFTQNPSFDDNIFFMGLNITARAGINEPPPPPDNGVPDAGSTALLLSLGTLALGAIRRRL